MSIERTKTRSNYRDALAACLLVFAMLGTGSAVKAQTRQDDPDTNRHYTDNETTRTQAADMDRFLDSHPEVAEQLQKDPSLINKREFVENHPSLRDYLQDHPGVREEFSENPDSFMRREERYDRREGDRDISPRELAGMDHFLDGHPEIAEQLRKDPSLIKNRQWVENHPALQEYLQNHPGVREEFRENPNAFMRHEERYDRREDDRVKTGDRDGSYRLGDRDDRGELSNFGQFLGGHSTLAQQLAKDPSLANSKEYLANHHELAEYLKSHPAMTQRLAQNPQGVMSSNWVQQAGSPGVPIGTKPSMPKPRSNPNQ